MRTWTVEEANAALLRVRELVTRVHELLAAARIEEERVRGNGHGRPSPNGRAAPRRSDADLRAALDELDADGIVLRDAERGLVDFHAVSRSGRPYLLCWLVAEAEVAWWHWPETGFGGRTPLTDPPP